MRPAAVMAWLAFAAFGLPSSTGAVDLALDFSNPRVLYATMWDNRRTAWELRSGGPGSGIWRSVDGGEPWERLTDDLPEGMGKIGVASSPARPGRVWSINEAGGDEGRPYRSDVADIIRLAGPAVAVADWL